MLRAKQNLFKKMLRTNQTSKVRGLTNIQVYEYDIRTYKWDEIDKPFHTLLSPK